MKEHRYYTSTVYWRKRNIHIINCEAALNENTVIYYSYLLLISEVIYWYKQIANIFYVLLLEDVFCYTAVQSFFCSSSFLLQKCVIAHFIL